MLLAGMPREPFASGAAAAAPPYNSLVAINTDGEIVASYDKAHLVPFGEFLPFGDLLAQVGIRQFVPGAAGWSEGDARRRVMTLPASPAPLVLICYEILFSGDLGDVADAHTSSTSPTMPGSTIRWARPSTPIMRA